MITSRAGLSCFAVAGERLVDGVVDHLVDEMMQSPRVGRTDVHRRTFPHRLQSFEYLNLSGTVLRFLGHKICLDVSHPG